MGACFEAAGDQGGGEESFKVEGEGVLFQAEGFSDFGEGEVWAFVEQYEDGLSGWVVEGGDNTASFLLQGVFFYGSHMFRDAEQV